MGRRVKHKETARTVKLRVPPSILNLNKYEPNIDLRNHADDFWNVKTVPEMMALLERRKDIELDARVMGIYNGDPVFGVPMAKKQFLESAASNQGQYINPRSFEDLKPKKLRFKEGFNDVSEGYGVSNAGLVGDDFVPLLGGPFNHQQYINDYLQATSQAFYAFHHDPIARLIVTIIRDFSLGRSFRVDSVGRDKQKAEILWRAVEKVNDLEYMMNELSIELSLYGETMLWELPDSWSKIEYKIKTDEESPYAWLPRFRLIDPTVIWDIITYPEDISRVLAYQWVAPTQYQIYTRDNATGVKVPSLKFIYQQIPAAQVDHWKINVVSDEKRGRGDLYPVLGYLKYLRDVVAYRVISLQKNSAWSIDTTIDGSMDDINDYADAQQQLGTLPPAGSEFIHSAKIKRDYLGNNLGGGPVNPAWDECANMIAAGTGIPISYWGLAQTHGSSRASSMVATEPVVKRFEMRRRVLERIIKRMYERVMARFDLESTCEVTFPELVVQDRTSKLADLALASQEDWFSRERVATAASKEFDFSDYDFGKEQEKIKQEQALPQPQTAPLTTPGKAPPLAAPGAQKTNGTPYPGDEAPAAGGAGLGQAHPQGMTAEDKRGLRLGRGA